MDKLNIRHYLLVGVAGVCCWLNTSVVAAQTATDVNCTRCVGRGEIDFNTVTWSSFDWAARQYLINQANDVNASVALVNGLEARVETLEAALLAALIDPTLASIQTLVFTPTCSGCHEGPPGSGLPEGMDLSSTAASFSSLVGVASQEVPALLRVKSADPANSYLIQKLEGTHAEGERMPRYAPPLAQGIIAVIRVWIQLGATL